MIRDITLRQAADAPTSRDLPTVAAQLIEAAWHARDGDSEAVKAHIARAVALLDGHSGVRPVAVRADSNGAARIRRGAFAAWQAQRLAAHVNADLGAKIYIKDLAAFVGVSVSYVCGAFKRTFGMPAHICIAHRWPALATAVDRPELLTGLSCSRGGGSNRSVTNFEDAL